AASSSLGAFTIAPPAWPSSLQGVAILGCALVRDTLPGRGHDAAAQVLRVTHPMLDDGRGTAVVVEDLLQDAQPPIEVGGQNRVLAVGGRNVLSLVLHSRPEMGGGKLELHLLDALARRGAKHEADHGVVENAVHEVVDDEAQGELAPQFL